MSTEAKPTDAPPTQAANVAAQQPPNQPPPQQPPQQPAAPVAMGGGAPGAVPGAAAGAFQNASLYIGDLLPEVNEGLLFEIFNAVGPVASIRVCRDAVTRRSLGYAYVNYHQVADAERALDSMNFTDIKGKPCRIMWSQRDPSIRRSGQGNIFVKNLHEGIDNKQLYDTFSLFGNILSCKVVTDKATGLSKGYGYVHYETNEAAASAIEKLDGMLIDGKEVQVGVFMRRDNRPDAQAFTNCFLKNIPYEWDDKRLEEEFGKFGEIVSCSISMGKRVRKPKVPENKPVLPPKDQPVLPPKEDLESDKKEEEKVEGENGDDEKKPETSEEPVKEEPKEKKSMFGGLFGGSKKKEDKKEDEPKKEDDAAAKKEGDDEPKADESEAKAEESKEEKEPTGPESLGFGFVNFATHDGAAAALEEMNDKSFHVTEDGETIDKILFVGRAQKKSERERELRQKYESEKMDRIAKFQGVNLYVKNLEDTVDDDMLRAEFSAMGTITSARVMREDSGRSKGFGFVCFSTPEDSTRAVNEMNGKIMLGKPIYVALAQRREVRRAQLEAQHNTGRGGGGGQMMRGPMGGPGMGGYPGAMPMGTPMYRPQMMGAPQMMGGRGGYPGMPPGGYQMAGRGGYGGGMMPAQPGRGGRGPQAGRGRMGPGGRGPPPQGRGPYGPGPQGRGGPAPIKFNQAARNMPPPQGGPQNVPPPGPGAQPPAPPSNEQLTPAALASATPEIQKNMIGERLYPLIHQSQPELAGKITGMLLEMDNSELLHLLESPEALNAKIHEALQVLEAHAVNGK